MTVKLSGGEGLEAALQERLAQLRDAPTLRVGLLETAIYPDGTPVAQVAFWNEYGTVNSPPRPFFRNTIRQRSAGWGVLAGQCLANAANPEQAMGWLGERMKDDITTSIVNFTTPANAQSTQDRKGFNKPLDDTGVMKSSVGWDFEE